MGKGFAFVSRQERLTLDGDHFYIDLVFYHAVLKCYVLIELKTGKLTHQDLGQLQLYVNYFDRERRSEGDNPTLGLILCADKNDAVVRYTLGPDQRKTIFASRYKLHLPSCGPSCGARSRSFPVRPLPDYLIETGRRHAELLGDVFASQSGEIQQLLAAFSGKENLIDERARIGSSDFFMSGFGECLSRQEALLALGRVQLTETRCAPAGRYPPREVLRLGRPRSLR